MANTEEAECEAEMKTPICGSAAPSASPPYSTSVKTYHTQVEMTDQLYQFARVC